MHTWNYRLAKILFVNQTAVSQWERGITIPAPQTLIKLSKIYGVSIDYILGTSDERQSLDDGHIANIERLCYH